MSIQCSAVITQSIFSQILLINTQQLAGEGNEWVVCCGSYIWFTFCHCYGSVICNTMEIRPSYNVTWLYNGKIGLLCDRVHQPHQEGSVGLATDNQRDIWWTVSHNNTDSFYPMMLKIQNVINIYGLISAGLMLPNMFQMILWKFVMLWLWFHHGHTISIVILEQWCWIQ